VGTSYLDFDRYIDDLLPMTAFDFLAGAITVVAIVLLASILNPYVCISFVHGIDYVHGIFLWSKHAAPQLSSSWKPRCVC
jgi:hypothetical protein